MEYILGVFIALIGIAIIYTAIQYAKKTNKTLKVKVSQSRSYEILAPYVLPIGSQRLKNRQSVNHLTNTQIRILMTDSKAYWIKDNAVYSADVKNGIIVDESAKIVDMMAIDTVELEEMMFIIDRLTEGKANDYRNSRDS